MATARAGMRPDVSPRSSQTRRCLR
jgi:hypothetical protein